MIKLGNMYLRYWQCSFYNIHVVFNGEEIE